MLTPSELPKKQDSSKMVMDKIKSSPVVALFKGGVPISNVVNMDFSPNLGLGSALHEGIHCGFGL